MFLLEAEQEIGLILGVIQRAQQFVAPRDFVAANPGVVAGRQAVGADLARGHEQRIELHVVVAHRARNRRAAREIFLDKRLHHGFLESLLVIHNVVRHAEVLGHALGVINVVERAAALAVRAVAVELRQAALVPQLHRQADDGKAALLQDRGNGRAVHAAAHRDGCHRALIWSTSSPSDAILAR